MNMRAGILLLATLGLTGCGEDPEKRYNAGYGDGYAEGYNTACKIRATMVEGAWDDEHYSRGYNHGRQEGVMACYARSR